MSNPKSLQAAWTQDDWKRLALGSNYNGRPPIQAQASTPSREPTLTEIFNRAASKNGKEIKGLQIVSKNQLKDLKKMMSQPRATYDMTPLGSVRRSCNVEADRRLMHTITALSERLAKKKGASQEFSKAAKKGELKREFNKSSMGWGR